MTTDKQRARGHLLAKWFGGSGAIPENLVPLYQNANLRMRSIVEDRVANELTSGRYEAVIYRVTRVYQGDNLIPRALTIEAVGQDANGRLTSIFEGSLFNQN